jgi:DNA invertase Pin-like site-specific DNA recombinase
MIYGYVNVRKNIENRELIEQKQANLLRKKGAEKILVETDGSGLRDLLQILNPGDALHVLSTGHLGRNIGELMKIIKFLSEKNITLYIAGEKISLEPIDMALMEASLLAQKNEMETLLKIVTEIKTDK